MNEHVRVWREDQKHLPEFMRDFHDCKDLFKAMHSYLVFPDGHPAGNVGWILGHQYIIDVFLWFMAEHGYTMQKNRAKLEFSDIHELIATAKKQRSSASQKLFKGVSK